MASTDKLCAELYDYIIDFLHDDHSTLRSCALVCRSWVPTTRIHLFYSLELKGPSTTNNRAQDTACNRIFRTILSSPYLAPYVKKLLIVESNFIRRLTYRWVSEEITFPSLLKKFACLRVLEFNFPPPSTDDVNFWSATISRDIRLSVSSIALESFTLRQFLFISLLDFIKIMFCCQHLKTLQLDHVDIASTARVSNLESMLNFEPTQNVPKKPRLENLLLRSNSSYFIIPAILHTSSISGLRTLVMSITADSNDNAFYLLKGIPNLEVLELEINQAFDYNAHLVQHKVINLSLLPSLRTLSFQSSVLLGRTEPLPWLVATLSTFASSNILEDLSLMCIVDKPPPSLTIQAFDNILLEWRNLDNTLTEPKFALMRRFRLDFALDNPIGDESVEFISQEFVKQLEGLRAEGILEVDVCELR